MKFIKENFTTSGEWISYNRRFVARTRSGGQKQFINFLIKNFEVEEYFDMYNNGLAPLEILHTKGFISPNMRKALKSYGFPATQEGQKAFLSQLKEKIKLAGAFGFCYWAPDWVAWDGPESKNGSSWENQTLFDFENKETEATEVFSAPSK